MAREEFSMRIVLVGLLLLVLPASWPTFASKPHDWQSATVTEVTYSADEKLEPHSHRVKREGCQGGIGCYDTVQDEPTHIPLKVATYHFETDDKIYLARMGHQVWERTREAAERHDSREDEGGY
jgi:hypothetical protein